MLNMAQARESDMRGSHPVALVGSLLQYPLTCSNSLLLINIKVNSHFRIGHLYCFGMDDDLPELIAINERLRQSGGNFKA